MLRRIKESNIVQRILPAGSRRRKLLARLVASSRERGEATSISYDAWLRACEPKLFADTTAKLNKVVTRPLISIVVPCYNTPDKYLQPLLDSVKSQVYDHWQLCLADGSTDAGRSRAIQEGAALDDRITYRRVGKNVGIVGNTNFGLI